MLNNHIQSTFYLNLEKKDGSKNRLEVSLTLSTLNHRMRVRTCLRELLRCSHTILHTSQFTTQSAAEMHQVYYSTPSINLKIYTADTAPLYRPRPFYFNVHLSFIWTRFNGFLKKQWKLIPMTCVSQWKGGTVVRAGNGWESWGPPSQENSQGEILK